MMNKRQKWMIALATALAGAVWIAPARAAKSLEEGAATTSPSMDLGRLRKTIAGLMDDDPAVRQSARDQLLSLRRRDLPAMKAALEGLAPLDPSLVQDLREIDARVQQEKLAAMGRLVASVAHEIRNPLGAIGQANQLAGEYAGDPAQLQRLHHLIGQNVERINRTVEDVLELGRNAPREVADSTGAALLREVVAEFDAPAPGRIGLFIQDDAALLRFDPLHLRRVLVNLLSNARRYASAAPRAIEVRQLGAGRVREIQVANDGPVIDAELRAQLFEPFRTTSHRGVGLGLYISLELCARNGARLVYRVEDEQGDRPRGHFAIQIAPDSAA